MASTLPGSHSMQSMVRRLSDWAKTSMTARHKGTSEQAVPGIVNRERATEWAGDFYSSVDGYDLVPNLRQCLACGKCTGGCPVAALNPSYNPRQIIRDVLAGNTERLLESEEIWRCFWCASCYMGCPVDIHFPLLMMQLRYRAFEKGNGLRYVAPFKKFAVRSREDGLTFVPSRRAQKQIREIRREMGMAEWPEISEKAREEFRALFDSTGTTEWLDTVPEDSGRLRFTYLAGRIMDE